MTGTVAIPAGKRRDVLPSCRNSSSKHREDLGQAPPLQAHVIWIMAQQQLFMVILI